MTTNTPRFRAKPASPRGVRPVAAGGCLTDMLLEQAALRPGAPAVVCGPQQLSFGELARVAAGVGVYLQHLGTARDECVGLFVEPSLELMVGVWGTLFAGGAYQPLSPEYPEERLRYMVQHSRARVILCQDALKPKLQALAPHNTIIVGLGEVTEYARHVSQAELELSMAPSDLAYVIYTSGSTGQPKGVMIEHASIVSQMRWLAAEYGLGPATVVLQKTPMSFDAAQWEILAPACGAKVVMGSPGMHRDPERLLAAVAEHGVTALQCVPTLLQAVLDAEGIQRAGSLKQIFSGGEALSKSLALRCLETLPACELVNLYGPTECTINASSFRVHPAALDKASDSVPIGAPVQGTEYHVLSPARVPVAPGEIGELYISGLQIARGYLHEPDLTAERFIFNPFSGETGFERLYRTGDLVSRNARGEFQFVGRTDNQVKLCGFRIELDEIRLAVENHDWIRHAGVVVKDDPASGFQSLIAFIELNPAEAALMDQGNHGQHHQSKADRVQLKAQLSNSGCRTDEQLSGKPVIALPGRTPTPRQRRRVFARKTYRFFEGGEVTRADILRVLEPGNRDVAPRCLDTLSLAELGEILRYFGQFHSSERLLPKYGYASPGALYATQMYLELSGVAGLAGGLYYYHPVDHRLVLIRGLPDAGAPRLRVHFAGRAMAITPVYQTNVQEVLAIEAGHMAGLFDEVLPDYGLSLQAVGAPAAREGLDGADNDVCLGAFEIVPYAPASGDGIKTYVQAHSGRVADLPAGQYHHDAGELHWVSDERILRKHVIAINQQVYERSSFGVTLLDTRREGWMSYLGLGRRLQRLMMNDLGIGFMSSGYSSESGHPLPSARCIDVILEGLGNPSGASYFFLGGRVSDAQSRDEGMKEDVVHMNGPAEMVKDDLADLLPKYMVPNRIVVLDALPLTANGKVDLVALAASPEAELALGERVFVAPRTRTEEEVAAIWRSVTQRDAVSVQDDFLEFGGNSLMAVALVNRLNRALGCSLPLQVLFQVLTIEQLAAIVDSEHAEECSRLVPLGTAGRGRPVFCWPGLGGYTMNLRPLAERANLDRPIFGVQAHGINAGEVPYDTIREMAAADVEALRREQPEGPYTLWGYSFGARVAFEATYQLEQANGRVDHLFLIAPGSPKVRAREEMAYRSSAAYRRQVYLTILFSVFSGSITDPALEDCLAEAADEESFVSFVTGRYPDLHRELITRIVEVVRHTYHFEYEFHELAERRVSAPITIFRARGDDYSFIEGASGYSAEAPTVVNLDVDHYGLLRDPGVDALLKGIRYRLALGSSPTREASAGGTL